MQLPALQFFPCPTDHFGHQARGVERSSRFKHDGDLLSSLVKGPDAVGLGLVFSAMMRILFAVFEQVAVQLLEMVFCRGDRFPGLEN